MANKFTISTTFSAIDKMTGPIGKMTSKVQDMGAKVGNVMGKIGGGLKIAGAGALAVGGAMAGAAIGVYKLAESVSNLGDNVAKTARSMGMTTDALQEFRYIGERSGVTVEEMDVALRKLTVNLGKETDSTVATLAMLGLSVEKMRAAGPDDVLNMVAEGMKNIADPATRAAIAVELFGRGGVKMVNVLGEGRDGMAALADEAHRVGYVLGQDTLDASEKLNDSILNMQTSFKAIGNQLAAKFMPLVNQAVDGITNFLVENRGVFDNVATSLVAIFEGLGPIVGSMLPVLSSILKTVGNTLNKVFKAAAPIIEKILLSLAAMLPSLTDIVEVVTDLLAPAFELLAPILEIILPIVEFLIKYIAWLARIISTVLAPVLSTIANVIKSAFTAIKTILGNIWTNIITAWEAVGKFFTDLWAGIVTAAQSAWSGIQAGFDAVAGALMTAWSAVGDFFTGLWDGIVGAFNSAVGFITDLMQPVIDMIDGIVGALQAIGLWTPPPAVQSAIGSSGAPVSANSQYMSASSGSAYRSTVDVNFNNTPAGTTVKQTGKAPGVKLTTGMAEVR
jgi:hypothetical protein